MSEVQLSAHGNTAMAKASKAFGIAQAEAQYVLNQEVARVLYKVKSANRFKKIEFVSGNGTWLFKVDGKIVETLSGDYEQLDELLQLFAGTFNIYANDFKSEEL